MKSQVLSFNTHGVNFISINLHSLHLEATLVVEDAALLRQLFLELRLLLARRRRAVGVQDDI